MLEKLPPFLDSANSRLPLQNYPFRHESWYERGIRLIGGVGGGTGM